MEITQNEKANLLAEMLEANKNAASIDVKGKGYITVAERIKAFRKVYPFGSIVTEIISVTENSCLIKATIYNNEGACLSNAHALEYKNSTPINKFKYVENCETSAIGRALGHCGFGDSNASSSEEANSQSQQSNLTPVINEQELEAAYATRISNPNPKIHGKTFKEVVPAFGAISKQIAFLNQWIVASSEATDNEKEAAKIIITALSQNN